MNHPSALEQYASQIYVANLDDALSIAAGPLAPVVTNNDLLQYGWEQGLDDQQLAQAKPAIDATGFTRRHLNLKQSEDGFSIEKLTQESASIAAHLSLLAAQEMGWTVDDIDMIIDTSAFLPHNLNSQIQERLQIRKPNRSYRMACAGAVAALIDAAAIDSPGRIMITSSEPLDALNIGIKTPQDLLFPSIFSNCHTAMAVDLSRLKLRRARIKAKADNGVIKFPTFYQPAELPTHNFPMPDYCTDEDTILYYNDEQRSVRISSPENNVPHMDGAQTGLFFSRETPPVIEEVLCEFSDSDIEVPLCNMVVHTPSQPVLRHISKNLARRSLLERDQQLRFNMADAGNSSSATTICSFARAINDQEINPEEPLLIAAPGVGATIAAGVFDVISK